MKLLFLMLPAILLTATLTRAAPAQSLDPILLEPSTAAPQPKPPPPPVTQKLPPTRKPAQTPVEIPSPPKPADKPRTIFIDKDARRLTLSGRFTGTAGAIELAACTTAGKDFLAAVLLDASAPEIAAAMKSLGFAPGKVPVADPKTAFASAPEGESVDLFLEWDLSVRNRTLPYRVHAEELFWDRAADRTLPLAHWLYAGGARVRDQTSDSEMFTADLSGSVATINPLDTSALFYYAGPLDSTQAWHANPALHPPKGTPCQLIVQPLPKPEAPAPQPVAPTPPNNVAPTPQTTATPAPQVPTHAEKPPDPDSQSRPPVNAFTDPLDPAGPAPRSPRDTPRSSDTDGKPAP